MMFFVLFILFYQTLATTADEPILGKLHFDEVVECGWKAKQKYPDQVNYEVMSQWYLHKYDENTPEYSRFFIDCFFTKIGFYDTETNKFLANKFHDEFSLVPLDTVSECAKKYENVDKHSPDRTFLPFVCILKTHKKEVMRGYFKSDEVYDNPSEAKRKYIEMLEKKHGKEN